LKQQTQEKAKAAQHTKEREVGSKKKKIQTEHRLSIGLEKKRCVISCLSPKQIISTGAYQIVPVSGLSGTKRNILRKNTVEEKE